MSAPLEGKTAVVTGAASGLGNAIARTLAEAGCRVVGTDLDQARLNSALSEVEGARGIAFDLRDADQVSEAWREFDELGDVHILVNNAGVDHTRPINELTVEQIDQVLDVNLRGPFLMGREAIIRWCDRGSGDIVNICSTASKRAWPNASAYHASKWGLLGLSHAMYCEARPNGVRVTAVVVGDMRTPFILGRSPDIPLDSIQPPSNAAAAILGILQLPDESVVPEIMVVPTTETSWP